MRAIFLKSRMYVDTDQSFNFPFVFKILTWQCFTCKQWSPRTDFSPTKVTKREIHLQLRIRILLHDCYDMFNKPMKTPSSMCAVHVQQYFASNIQRPISLFIRHRLHSKENKTWRQKNYTGSKKINHALHWISIKHPRKKIYSNMKSM